MDLLTPELVINYESCMKNGEAEKDGMIKEIIKGNLKIEKGNTSSVERTLQACRKVSVKKSIL